MHQDTSMLYQDQMTGLLGNMARWSIDENQQPDHRVPRSDSVKTFSSRMDQSVVFPENYDLRYTDKSIPSASGHGGSHYMPH